MTSQEAPRESGNSLPDTIKTRTPSPHHNPPFVDPSSGLSLDPSMAAGPFATPSFTNPNPASTGPESYGYAPDYLSTAPVSQTLTPSDPNVPHGLPLSQSFGANFTNELEQPSAMLQQENYSNLLNSNQTDFDFSVYQNPSPNSSTGPEYDTSQLLDPQIHQRQAVNPADLSRMSSPHTSPSSQLSPQDQMQPPQHPSSPMSPPSSAGAYYTPQHSRHASLDPSAASYLASQPRPDWQAIMGSMSFQGHRRAPSEVSDVSSAAHSPYMSQHESFDGVENNPSPLLAPQDPSLYDSSLGIESFTISDQQQQQGLSPGQSPYISPQLMPQQGTDLAPNGPYMSAPAVNPQYPTPPTDMYGNEADMVGMTPGGTAGDLGQASSMAPPSINVEFAPPSKDTSFGGSKPTAGLDSLSPPSIRK